MGSPIKWPVEITREWYDMTLPLQDRDPERWYLFFIGCVRAAGGTIESLQGFEDEELNAYFLKTRIKVGAIGKRGFVGIKKKRGRPRKAESEAKERRA